MKPELRRIGREQSPVVVIDEFTGRLGEILGLAETLAPFPALKNNYYPGLRRLIEPADGAANDYVERLCREAAQFIAGAFDVEGFSLIEASFSMVTTAPSDLSRPQRAPHFDSTDPKHYALLHYLRVPAGSGTAFYRQRSTGIERVTEANIARFVTAAEREARLLPAESGYVSGSDQFFEQITSVEAVPDRLLIYQGGLLHSGVIPPGMSFSSDPREGRLTANLFVRGD
ncbi:DUF6445 family protein [Sphingomonas sp.]|uniref:DUF6445 family protein n=1 Tax=Sphingomonas sp. TaxID=28214 RepID=UPI00389FC840